jgi:non-specific protein-tyrosine kinase
MELKQYWNLILRNLSMVTAFTLIFGFLGLIISFLTPKMYSAESQLFVSTPTSIVDIAAMAQGSNFSQQRVISYARVVSGPATLVPVISDLKLKMTPSELAKKISASAPLGTVLLNIEVRDSSPIRAAAISNAVAIQFGETIKSIELPKFGDSTGVKATVIKSAVIPSSPSSPNTKLNLLSGLLLGFIIACIIGVIRQVFDSTVKNVQHLHGAPLLGTIDFDEAAQDSPLISSVSNYSIRSEAFRHLRTTVKSIGKSSDLQVLAVTSAFPGEGKSTTSINLAISFAQTGLKVALIEADLRRPSFSKYLGVFASHSEAGLTGALDLMKNKNRKVKIESLLKTFGSREDQIEWLSSGAIPSNPAESLEMDEFDQFLSKLRSEYDLVIIDTPPLLPVTDAAIVGAKCDGVIVVARAGSTKVNALGGVIEILNGVGANVLGVVINMVPPFAKGEQYGYSYNRYESRGTYGSYYDSGYQPYAPLLRDELHDSAELSQRVGVERRIIDKVKRQLTSSKQGS